MQPWSVENSAIFSNSQSKQDHGVPLLEIDMTHPLVYNIKVRFDIWEIWYRTFSLEISYIFQIISVFMQEWICELDKQKFITCNLQSIVQRGHSPVFNQEECDIMFDFCTYYVFTLFFVSQMCSKELLKKYFKLFIFAD